MVNGYWSKGGWNIRIDIFGLCIVILLVLDYNERLSHLLVNCWFLTKKREKTETWSQYLYWLKNYAYLYF